MEPLNNKGGGNPTLGIHVHHARNIHNICIYEKQDVYAKFSLTYDPDHTVSTPIIRGGGRNPDFNQDMAINITHPDAVLKCEIWMLSRAKHLMDDQLLGFALVPVSSLSPNANLTQDFHLSSTDLFHSPAGTIRLSLLLNTINNHTNNTDSSYAKTSHDSDDDAIVGGSEEYCRMEFPDIRVAEQNREMVREYFVKEGAFLQLGAGAEDYEMAGNSSEGSSGVTSQGDDRNTGDSIEEEEEEEEAMQKQIVEMYVRSMQQFTESLAKMKLPMDLDKDDNDNDNEKKKKDSSCSRVFYGSRAFF